jgi:hypothetical protein
VSSNINYASINENFPVAGEDNDTQVFRDNFDTIKNSLATAKDEVSDLINDTAKTNTDNDFENNTVSNAVFLTVKEKIFSGGNPTSPSVVIDFLNAHYQIYTFSSDKIVTIQNLPDDQQLGRLTLELYGTSTQQAIAKSIEQGTTYRIVSLGNTNWNQLAGTSGVAYTVGNIFTAAISGENDALHEIDGIINYGQIVINQKITLNVPGGGIFLESPNFPRIFGPSPILALESSNEPVILEIWRHSSNRVFLNYLGRFS